MAARTPKRRKLSPPGSDDRASGSVSADIQKAFFKSAAGWNLEQDYESRPRVPKKGKKEKESSRLPIKTPDGRIEQQKNLEEEAPSVDGDGDWPDESDHDDLAEESDDAVMDEPSVPESQQIFEAKEELAKIAVALNEEPEENMGAFKALAKVGESKLLAIKRLTLATQLAVYKDVIPGYRIRPLSDDVGKDSQVSKDVRNLWTYEQALISGYQAYVKELVSCAKSNDPSPSTSNNKKSGPSIASVAISCACALLTSVPHFNFRGELLRIVVGKLSKRRVDTDFVTCRETLEKLFKEDEEGNASFEAVSLLSKMMKARDFRVDESVPNLFLHLRLLSEFSGKASQDRVDQQRNGDGTTLNGKQPKRKREFRTKRQKKEMKEQKKLDQDMAQADATVSHEERDRMQSETLKMVFATYFRILKLRVPALMGAVLEGLAKYAHLINQDFFGDLLEALKDLIRHSDREDDGEEANGGLGDGEETSEEEGMVIRDTSREALLCTVTAFALLRGQDAHNSRSTLHLDLTFFMHHLYQSLLPLCTAPDLELTSKSLRLNDPSSSRLSAASTTSNRINIHTTTVLLIRCLTAVLLPPWNIRSVPPLRLTAFAKQLMAVSLHVPEKSAQGILALLDDVARTHGKKVASLWNTEERKGDGTFIPLAGTPEGSNPLAATVWEGEILRMHFSPKVREGARNLERRIGSSV